jgi:hypothetical protein
MMRSGLLHVLVTGGVGSTGFAVGVMIVSYSMGSARLFGSERGGGDNAVAGTVTRHPNGMTTYDGLMAVERLTVSIESELAVAVRKAAEADEQNVSAWLADAARRQLANRGLRDVVAAWEREHGAFSDEELAAARALVHG